MAKDKKPDREAMPYRRNAGVVVFNRSGQVFVGRRADLPTSEYAWQFPQGGIDKGEEPIDAALRELFEETSIRSISILTATSDWVRYDLPDELLGTALKGKYRGQEQMWFAALFEGDESEIDILEPGDGHHAEFCEWAWVDLEATPERVIPFKRPAYEQIVAAFRQVPEKLKELEQ